VKTYDAPDYAGIPDLLERLERLADHVEQHPDDAHVVQMAPQKWARIEPKDTRRFVNSTRAFVRMQRGLN
jgi:hypothetical protein